MNIHYPKKQAYLVTISGILHLGRPFYWIVDTGREKEVTDDNISCLDSEKERLAHLWLSAFGPAVWVCYTVLPSHELGKRTRNSVTSDHKWPAPRTSMQMLADALPEER